MSSVSAKEMFEKLGYRSLANTSKEIIYDVRNEIDNFILFDKENKFIYCSRPYSLETLQAINQQVKELGWNER